jgi:uncharacterized protein (DUF1800 family)
MDATLSALNRFGLGARLGEPSTIEDPKEWLRGQLDADPRIEGPELRELGDVLSALREAQRARSQEALGEARRRLDEIIGAEISAMLATRVRTSAPYVERLVAFWSNHLCVSSAAGPQVALLAGHYERTVIRPHVLGRFADMVLASARHPAMLAYLNNAQSVGPESPAARMGGRGARGGGRARGLNENYARELLELHTLGVDGGYSQADVVELAEILTGWTLAGVPQRPAGRRGSPAEPLGATFRPAAHQPGPKTVLGVRYAEAGMRESEEVIRDLCAHPSTARFIATKLVRHFVSDEPPSRAVDAVAATFHDSGGDLREVAETLIDVPEAWDTEARKLRTPVDWLTAVLRAFRVDAAPEPARPLLGQLRQPVWAPPSPKGYGDTTAEWADPDSLMNRAELARTIVGAAGGRGRGRGRFAVAVARAVDPRALLQLVQPEDAGPLEPVLADTSIASAERVALAIGGPAFQWR